MEFNPFKQLERNVRMMTEGPPTVAELSAEWESLSQDEREEIYTDFQNACIESNREPSPYWYPLLMPKVMKSDS